MAKGDVQLEITPHVPQGWLGEQPIRLQLCCVAHPDHPLHRLGRGVTDKDLKQHRQLVVRETSNRRDSRVAWLGAEQRLTVSTMGTRIQALSQGLGFAWSPVLKIQKELDANSLKALPLEHGGERYIEMYLFLADEIGAGPATRSLAQAIRERVAKCP